MIFRHVSPDVFYAFILRFRLISPLFIELSSRHFAARRQRRYFHAPFRCRAAASMLPRRMIFRVFTLFHG